MKTGFQKIGTGFKAEMISQGIKSYDFRYMKLIPTGFGNIRKKDENKKVRGRKIKIMLEPSIYARYAFVFLFRLLYSNSSI